MTSGPSANNHSQIHPKMAQRLRLSGILLLVALAVEAFSLLWANPTAFLLFAGVGGLFFGAGIGVFLYSLVAVPAQATSRDRL